MLDACPASHEVVIRAIAEDTAGQQSTDTLTANCVPAVQGTALLSVDFQYGSNTEAGFVGFGSAQTPATTYLTSEGNVTVGVSGQLSFLDRNSLTDVGDLTNADLYNDAIYDLEQQSRWPDRRHAEWSGAQSHLCGDLLCVGRAGRHVVPPGRDDDLHADGRYAGQPAEHPL